MLELGDSRCLLYAVALSELGTEVAGFSYGSDAGEARLREEIGVIAKVAV
jgi:hypothetical protein